MKNLRNLNNTDKAKLLHELFPDEIPYLLDRITAVCADLKSNQEEHRKTWDFGLMSFDMWLNLSDTVEGRIAKYRSSMIKSSKVFSDQLFGSFDYTVIFVNDRVVKTKPSFNKLNKVYKLQIGRLIFHNPGFAATDLSAHDMDGRFGWNLFEGKQVEMDFDKSVMIVHSGKLIKAPKGYVRSPLDFKHSFMIVKGAMKKGGQIINGDFLMDTGAESAIILDSTWVAQHDFASGLPLIKTIPLTNPRGIKFEIKVVLAPAFVLNGFQLTGIPTLILGTRNPAGFSVNNVGGDVLKRFNFIMDFKNDCIYWKPNTLFNSTYHQS